MVATNWAGAGPHSGSAQATTFGHPDAPTGLTVSVGDSYVNITWTAPTFTGNTPVTGYMVYRSSTSGDEAPKYVAWLGPYYNDTAVVNGQIYFYQVIAVNDYYSGSISEEVHGTPLSVPSAPYGVAIIPAKEA